MSSIESAVEWKDVYGGILKSISFGLLISWVCCFMGFHTKHSAEGLATTETVCAVGSPGSGVGCLLTSVLLPRRSRVNRRTENRHD